MKILVIITFLLYMTNSYSQITAIEIQEKEKPVKAAPIKYDSLESLNYENAPLHEGQTLFIKGNQKSKKRNGLYDCFYTKIISLDEFFSFKRNDYVYKPITRTRDLGGEMTTTVENKYTEFVGKYYNILSIEIGDTLVYNTYWFKLMDNDQTPFYYRVTGSTNFSNVLTLGHYEKMKQLFVGKEYYTQGDRLQEKTDSKEKVSVPSNTKFRCIDIGVNIGEDGPVFAILENEKYGKIKGEITKTRELDYFISATKYNDFIKKYGPKFGPMVAVGTVATGMNGIMVLDAIGQPIHINTTKTSNKVHEQWVYYDNVYLYFENGILTTIQD